MQMPHSCVICIFAKKEWTWKWTGSNGINALNRRLPIWEQRPSPFLSREIDTLKDSPLGCGPWISPAAKDATAVSWHSHGFQVTALDISDVGLGKAAQRARRKVRVDFRQVDLDEYRFTEQFDLIINFNFLLRELIPAAVRALAPGGLLMIDTIMESPDLLTSHNPAYLLRRGELLKICEGLPGEILIHEELVGG